MKPSSSFACKPQTLTPAKRPILAGAVFALACFCAASGSQAAVITFQQGVSPTGSYAGNDATWARSDQPTVNQNGSGNLLAGNSASGADFHSFISFDLSAIPAGSTINSVSLTLAQFADAGSGATPVQLDLLQLTRVFVETQVTWNIYSTGNNWTTPGGDFNPTILSSITASAQPTASRVFGSSGSFVSVVQSAVNAPQPLELMLKLNDESGLTRNLFFFGNDEQATSTNRPLLTIDYTAVPEPSACLLALGGLGLVILLRGLRKRCRI